MLRLPIPNGETLELEHLVCDINGTLAEDGTLLDGVAGRIARLSADLHVHLLTADTHGTLPILTEELRAACVGAGVPGPEWLHVSTGDEKERYVRQLGVSRVVAVGNGANDVKMMSAVALSIGVIDSEGAYGPALRVAQVIARSALEALDLLLYPDRLIATIRP
jgi:soluble P-type ATPase